MDSIVLQSGENTVVDGDIIGRLGFAASSESDGSNAIAVVAKIEAIAEKTFTSSNNATEMIFYLAADGAAESKMTLSSAGNLTVTGDLQAANGTLSGLTVDSAGGIKVKNGDTGAGFVEFYEDSDNGTNKVTLIGRTSTGSDLTVSLPAYTGTLVCSTGTHTITASAATDTPLKLKGAGSQSANLQEWLDSSDGQLLAVGPNGGLIVKDGGNIGSASDTDAIAIASDGEVTLSQRTTFSKAVKTPLKSNTYADPTTFNLDEANTHTVTLGGNPTLAISNEDAGQKFIINLVQDGTGSRTVTWFSGIDWAGGSAPTLTTTANKADSFGFLCTGTDAYYGFVIGQNI
ncbi:MAG: hypothetical protein CL833_12735 [Crocinitomicaceae bacterium]|nr:hypothetical protein [Crocinitomicaceae bacterium]